VRNRPGTTRRLAEAGIVAAAYAALTVLLAPISYGPIQFRVPEVLKSLVIWRPHLILAFVIGNFAGNLTSPNVGPWELGFMPLVNLVGAALCAALGRRSPWVGAGTYAVIIAAGVAVMLSAILNVPVSVLFPPLLISEAILIVGGLPLMRRVHEAVAQWQRPAPGTERA
jgi:uncharacterized membrane protein